MIQAFASEIARGAVSSGSGAGRLPPTSEARTTPRGPSPGTTTGGSPTNGGRRRGAAGAGDGRVGLLEHRAVGGEDAVDDVRLHQRAAVREHREPVRHLERRQLRRAERGGQVRRDVLGRQAEALHVLAREADADLAHDADRHEVARARERVAQPRRAVEAAGVVARAPVFLLHGLARRRRVDALADADLGIRRLVDDRRVEHDGGGRESGLQRRRVDEGLERGTRLAARLDHAVELRGVVVEAARQRDDRAVVRVERDEGALDLRDLREQRLGPRPSGARRRRRRSSARRAATSGWPRRCAPSGCLPCRAGSACRSAPRPSRPRRRCARRSRESGRRSPGVPRSGPPAPRRPRPPPRRARPGRASRGGGRTRARRCAAPRPRRAAGGCPRW